MAIINFNNGNRYEGDVVRGVQHGQGTFVWASGNIYIGSFVEGSITGQGTKTYANGDIYTGSWEDGIKHGEGNQTWANGEKDQYWVRTQVPSTISTEILWPSSCNLAWRRLADIGS